MIKDNIKKIVIEWFSSDFTRLMQKSYTISDNNNYC